MYASYCFLHEHPGFASDQSQSACGARVQDTGLGCGTPPRAP